MTGCKSQGIFLSSAKIVGATFLVLFAYVGAAVFAGIVVSDDKMMASAMSSSGDLQGILKLLILAIFIFPPGIFFEYALVLFPFGHAVYVSLLIFICCSNGMASFFKRYSALSLVLCLNVLGCQSAANLVPH